MKKRTEKPIFVNNMDDIRLLVGYHPCQQIKFICNECGNEYVKSLHAVKDSGIFCQKCSRTLNGINKYGSKDAYKEHLKEVKLKAVKTMEKKYGSLEDVYKHRVDSYKKTCLIRYGVDNTSKLEENISRMKNNNPMFNSEIKEIAKKNYSREKHVAASKKAAEKMLSENLYKDRSDKCRETKMVRYGNPTFVNPQKTRNTFLDKYNCKSGFNLLITKKNKEIEDDGYIKISELSNIYDYYEEGVVYVLKKLGIEVKKYGKWRCIKRSDIPCDIDKLIEDSIQVNRSRGEIELFEFVKSICDDAINNDRGILNGKELDVYIPSKNVAIEFDCIKWHAEKDLLTKTIMCEQLGIRLIHIYEDEWLFKNKVCKSIIASALGVYSEKIFARKCELREIDSVIYNEFMDNNHIQGSINSKIRIGLYYNGELVECAGFGKSRYKSGEYELYRLCSKMNTIVVGGFSKIIKYALKKYEINNLISYVDRRIFNGTGYNTVGFKIVNYTKPSYFYVVGRHRKNRLLFQKHKLKNILKDFDETKTEVENMHNNGYNRIFDCGTIKVEYKYEL